jgi:DNA polymerase-3 subunit delta
MLADDLRALVRARAALDSGKPMPLALREARVWGGKERHFERVLPMLAARRLAQLLEAASLCDGIVKGLKHADWPLDAWDALRRLVLMAIEAQGAAPSSKAAPGARRVLALHA